MKKTSLLSITIISALSLFLGGCSYQGDCIDYKNADDYIGDKKCVTGEVNHVFEAPSGNCFINYCSNYESCDFSVVIFKDDITKFPDIQELDDQEIKVVGKITTYDGRPQMTVTSPSQITLIE